jgi:hypothetical protein
MHHGPVSPEIATGLLALKKRIDAAKIPPSKLDETINVAVWNIREFGRVKRTDAALHYIAEIIGQFDLVAIVELRNISRILAVLWIIWAILGKSSSPTGPTIAAATMSAPPFSMTGTPLFITASPPRLTPRASREATSGSPRNPSGVLPTCALFAPVRSAIASSAAPISARTPASFALNLPGAAHIRK